MNQSDEKGGVAGMICSLSIQGHFLAIAEIPLHWIRKRMFTSVFIFKIVLLVILTVSSV